MVYGLCRTLLNDPTDAEDATQQVFLSAYRSLLTGTTIEKPSAWLGTIARNECQARYAARARNPVALHDAATLVSPGADEQAAGRADAAELYSELAALPENQRAAVVLRDIYGFRYDEVAAALGTSRPAVEALLFRGRRRLQRRLRPGLAAGVLVVPLSLHESLAYAVPGFTTAAGQVGVAAGAVVVPLLAKAAAVGAAAALAGSAGVLADRQIRDSPARPFDTSIAQKAPPKPAPVAERPLRTRSLVSAGTPMLDARADAARQVNRSDDDRDGDHDDETATSEHERSEPDEARTNEHESTERDRGDDHQAEHEVLAEKSHTDSAHSDKATDSPDSSIELEAEAAADLSHDGEDVHEPESGGDSHSGSDSHVD